MRIVCDCGNEAHFNTIDEDTGEESKCSEDKGKYSTVEPDTFRFWEMHDEVGIVCEKCDRSIWLFT